ncbi:MAG: hypothetical protein IT436_05265 [Phycisphaerales bacterium]|nr:hypothetical protein [Phycisphaerales bacterium]
MFKPLRWTVTGTVAETRELKTKEGKVFGHSVKVATVGATFDLRVPDYVFARLGEGMAIEARGGVTLYNNNIQLAATQVAEIDLDEDGIPTGDPKPIVDPKAGAGSGGGGR